MSFIVASRGLILNCRPSCRSTECPQPAIDGIIHTASIVVRGRETERRLYTVNVREEAADYLQLAVSPRHIYIT